jgi:hypothetical protein
MVLLLLIKSPGNSAPDHLASYSLGQESTFHLYVQVTLSLESLVNVSSAGEF